MYILVGVAVIILQALLITGLLWQRAQRKSATGALEKLGGLLIHAQEEERASISRELHDDFSQRLALQCIELTQLEKNLPASEVEERARATKMLREMREVSADMRSLSHQLHSSRLELVGLVCALHGLSAEVTKNCRITVRFTEPEFPPNLTKDAELCLFRVAQEAIGNVINHSQASSAYIELGSDVSGVSLLISDAGRGFDPDLKAAGAGIGLMSMRERLRLLGGSLSVRSELSRGTEVLARIPLAASAKKATKHIA
jgi:signal transduction histidine kinase